MPNEQMVTSDPDFLDGEPIFTGTHVSVRLIVTLLGCGEIEDDLENAYPKLTREMLAYARALSESPSFKEQRRAFAKLLL